MAIAPTGAIFKSLSFDGEDSRDYGVYITGEAVYNAPERDVETISIPGRNGAFALDRGRFENIEVTYPAGVFAETEVGFAEAISDFRNLLCSRKGYARLTDDYNPDEYRLALYKSGLEVEPSQSKAGEFEITFDCKPQRYLMNGESPIDVTSGGTISNPTLFDASPMLEAVGYGDIGINGETISILNQELGEIKLSNATTNSVVTLNDAKLNTDDVIYKLSGTLPSVTVVMRPVVASQTLTARIDGTVSNGSAQLSKAASNSYVLRMTANDFSFAKGDTAGVNVTVPMKITLGSTNYTGAYYFNIRYQAGDETITVTATRTSLPTVSDMKYVADFKQPNYYGNSTKTLLPDVMYIDLENGEAYGNVDGEMMSCNSIVTMPAKLPALKPGTNTFTAPNTITQLKVAPRWWKV